MTVMSEEQYRTGSEEYWGICRECGTITYGGVEPDAEGYECESCGEMGVMGFEQALLMALIDIGDPNDAIDSEE